MPFTYNLPATVLSPKKNVSNVRVLYDGGPHHGEFSIARIEWNGNDVLGIRWNVNENEASDPIKISGAKVCLGEPNSRGKSTWFVLPDFFIEELLSGGDLSNKLKQYLEEK